MSQKPACSTQQVLSLPRLQSKSEPVSTFKKKEKEEERKIKRKEKCKEIRNDLIENKMTSMHCDINQSSPYKVKIKTLRLLNSI